jgi:hypothetical protein
MECMRHLLNELLEHLSIVILKHPLDSAAVHNLVNPLTFEEFPFDIKDAFA